MAGTENMSEPKNNESETQGGSCAPAHGSAGHRLQAIVLEDWANSDPAEAAEILFGVHLTELQKNQLRHLWNKPYVIDSSGFSTPKMRLLAGPPNAPAEPPQKNP